MAMEGYDREFWQFGDQLRLQTATFSGLSLGDSIWSPADNTAPRARNADLFSPSPAPDNNSAGFAAAKMNGNGLNGPGLIGSGKLAFGATTTSKADRYNNVSLPDAKPYANANANGMYGAKPNNTNMNNGFGLNKMAAGGGGYGNFNGGNEGVKSYFNKSIGRPASNNSSSNNFNGYGGKKGAADGKKKHAKNERGDNNHGAASEKRFKTLPASEALPRNEPIGGYIFVCNNDTMEENLKRQLFGLPSRYRDSVRAIRPGLPLFLYNYSTHQLHGIFEAASFGGANIDPAAWEDKKCNGESRFPAQVRVATRKICDPLEEDAFRPILHHYDGPKFRLELSITEALSLLDIFEDKDEA
ncbi:B2 protein-like [Triticum dicoccoides]|uniref:B2 protein-like n=1 Tax=Triticum dicoccoides TaxID=85692 RepID=UPI000E7AC94C|nr:B2 protein-like [Triticum dicoccoides]